MGFQFNHVSEYKGEEVQDSSSSLQLTKEDIEYLLTCISNGMFRGQDVEQLFVVTLKLQQVYLNME